MAGVGAALRGFGKALKTITKEMKDEKERLKKAPPGLGGPAKDPDTIKLDKQIKTAKKVGAGTVGAIGAAGVYGKAKQAFREKKKKKKKDKK